MGARSQSAMFYPSSKLASVGGLFHTKSTCYVPIGTKLPISDVFATVATGGNSDMTRTAQFSRE
jgi:hypothetical protein